MLVCKWSIHDERPTFLQRQLGKRRYRIVLFVKVDDYIDQTEIRPRKAVRMHQITDLAAKELISMLVGKTVEDAGFEVFVESSRNSLRSRRR